MGGSRISNISDKLLNEYESLEALHHTPFLPDLAPIDFYFFASLDNLLIDKKSILERQYKIFLKSFFGSRTSDFFEKDIKNYHCKDRNTLISGAYLE